ncbi:FAD-dependent oxidoreductase [Micrococcus sp. ACRRV]|uniref:FAD-dependent oxidoreductase n=1 Tax=Micrococcus sp. ACRRV TaxID=2918203 RepID=UPI001EF34E2F|nr:FAD-dependent oxidoreductase [Micrococcus sp. ACRRV]
MHVAVVGAGIIGLTAAVRLRAAGHAVTLIAPELDTAGRPHAVAGATHAAAGMLAPLAETQFSQDALAPLLQAGWKGWPLLVDLLAGFSDVGTGFRAEGSWIVAADPSDVLAWEHVLAHASALGRRVEPVAVRALRRAEPALAPGLAAGFDAPDDHQVDPRRAAAACLAALVAEAGPDGGPLPAGAGPAARLVSGTVTSTDPVGSGVGLTLESGAAIDADAAVLAAGLGHRGIGGAATAEVPLRPVHGDVLRLRVRPEQLLPGEDHLITRTVRGLVHGRQVYLVPRADGTLVVGASAREDGLAGTSAGSVLDLLADAAAILPAVRECELAEVTTAARPGTPDDAPRVEVVPGAPVVVATGFHRHGILLAPWAAGRVLDLLTALPKETA